MSRRLARRVRRLRDLRSVGPATVRDLAQLGVTTVEALAGCEPDALYDRLCAVTGVRHDPCVRDVFAAAVAQARDPDVPAAQRDWWWWSRRRLAVVLPPEPPRNTNDDAGVGPS